MINNCACGHPWSRHTTSANNVSTCKHRGCGCHEMNPADAGAVEAFNVFVAIGRVLFFAIASMFILFGTARSEPLPVPRPFGPGGSCPYGYVTSGSFCMPMSGAQDAIPKPPNGTCPFGWTSSGSYCLKSGSGR